MKVNKKKLSMKYTSPTVIKAQTNIYEPRKSKDFSNANPIKFVPYSIKQSALFDKGCITCGKDNIEVKYFGERHICLRCRNFLKTQNDDRAFVYLNDNGDVEVVGKSRKEASGQLVYYHVEPDQIYFKEYRCYATLAQEDELIVLLHDDQSIKKTLSKSVRNSITN